METNTAASPSYLWLSHHVHNKYNIFYNIKRPKWFCQVKSIWRLAKSQHWHLIGWSPWRRLAKVALSLKHKMQKEGRLKDTFSRSHRPRQLPQQMIAITVLVRCENTSTCSSLRAQQTQICSITVSKLNLWHEIRVMEDINFVEQQTNLHDFALESFDVDEHSYGNGKLCISTCQSKSRKWREVEVLSQRTRCVTNTAIENTWLKM